MAVFKCKMCGGAIDITSGKSVVECAYCGTQQTIPKTTDENIQTMFNRANLLRQKNEFDKAEEIYEKILLADATEAEAYWCVILCKFGIEYVEDPKTFKRIPTCHRTSYDSIIADEYYKLALQYADAVQKDIYESEAKIIDEIQKEILAISQKEEPYDVFICYKEADESGKRTQDSVIANDIYHQLTQEGFKVFYAAITLEDKLGSAYEPCIFAALNSAKVMLVVGTKEEHFNAVWVKNEWSRYLKLMKNDRSRILIPCYKDMDAYELPEEFAHLQAQDMSKIGFVNDVIRGVKKIIKTESEVKTVIQEKVISESLNANSTALLKRGFMALEDSEWKKADDFFEQVLNFDAECAEAYLGKLLAELCITKAEKLPDSSRDFENSSNFNKILRFGNKEIVDTVSTSLTKVKERIHKNYMDDLFQEALSVFSNAKTVADFNNAKARFAKISGWKNADEMCEKCKAGAEKVIAAEKDSVYSEAVKILNNAEITNDCEKAESLFAKIPGWKDSETKIEECKNKAKDIIYSEAEKILDTAKVSFYYNKAAEIFAKIPGWRDADAKIEECKQKAAELKAEEKRAEKQKKKKFVIVAISSVALIIACWIIAVIVNINKYNSAVELMNVGKYDEAIVVFEELDGYKDSSELRKECITAHAIILLENGKFEDAIAFFSSVENDGTAIVNEYKYNFAISLLESDKYTESITVFESLGEYNDSVSYKKYANAISLMNDAKYYEARAIFNELGEFLNSKEKSTECHNILVEKYSKLISNKNRISAEGGQTVGLKSDGTVVATGENQYGQCDVSGWTDIVAVSSSWGQTIGLKSDGTVVAIGCNDDGECDVSDWTNIIAISAGTTHTVGLKSDGTVVATGDNYYGECNVSDWTDIVAVTAGQGYTVGLKSDGTVVAKGDNGFGQCAVEDWTDIIAVSANDEYTVGFKADGAVVTTGRNSYGQYDVSDWTDIIALSADENHAVGLRSDGTVVAIGFNYDGRCDISDWNDIIAVYAGDYRTVGLKSDGSVVAVGDNDYRQCDVSDWDLF